MADHLKHTMRLHKILQERDYQPEWRAEAARCHQYYDGNQLSQDVIASLKAKRMPQLVINLMQPAINGVLGMEARSRTDWFVRPDDDEFRDIAEALNVRMNEGLRVARANQACAEAYKGQVISGIGWVEVKKNSNVLGSKYSIKTVHRNEISFDWRSAPDLSNCNWLLRERWVDKDQAKAHFPKHSKVIDQAVGSWSGYDLEDINGKGETLSHAYREFQYSTRDEKEWLLPHRDMVKVYELYYRVWTNEVVLIQKDGRAVVYQEDNAIHQSLVVSGRVRVERHPVPSLRLSWFIGPHFVADMKSPHPHNMYPYVPFFGAREDETGIPYGLARGMMSPQDEINFRRIRLTADLNYKRIIMDDDATKMSDDELRHNVHAADGIVKLDPNARREGGGLFKVESDQGISQQQFTVGQDAVKLIQDVAGIYNAYLGKEGGAQSGVAINSLVEQGATTLADINDNYDNARQLVGELVLAHEVEALKGQSNVRVIVPGKLGAKPKEVILNGEKDGEVSNAIAHAKTQVVLGEIQQSAGYRAQVSQMLMDFISKLPGEFQAAGLGIVVEQLDIPEEKRVELMKLVQKVTGEMDPDDMTPEQLEQYQQQQQEAQYLNELQMKELMLKLEKLAADIAKTTADTEYTKERAESEDVGQKKTMVEIQQATAAPPPLPDEFMRAM